MIAGSAVVRDIELPCLLELANDPMFTLSLASTVETPAGTLDYEAPDRLLGQARGTLAGLLQQRASTAAQRSAIAAGLCRRRLEHLCQNIADADHVLCLDVQTRVPPFAARIDADLMLRLPAPANGQRRPKVAGLHDLRRFLAQLPQLVAIAGAHKVEVRGGAHLSVACALDAALPTTLLGPLRSSMPPAAAGSPPSPRPPRVVIVSPAR